MEVTSGADVQGKTRRKIKWTKEMNETVLSCKHKVCLQQQSGLIDSNNGESEQRDG